MNKSGKTPEPIKSDWNHTREALKKDSSQHEPVSSTYFHFPFQFQVHNNNFFKRFSVTMIAFKIVVKQSLRGREHRKYTEMYLICHVLRLDNSLCFEIRQHYYL